MTKDIILIGAFPPPVHGAAKNLKIFSKALRKKSNVLEIDISPGKIERGVSYHWKKLRRVFVGILFLLFLLLRKRVSAIYISPDGGGGVYYSLIFVALASIFRAPLYLHHRSFSYINEKSLGMSLISFIENKKHTYHVFLCDLMKSKFENIYGIKVSQTISNAQYVSPVDEIKVKKDNKFIIGHLSNLGFGKGLKEVAEVCFRLDELNVEFHLELGGPPESEEVKIYLDTIMEKLGRKVTYHGPVQAHDKDKFYSLLDVFLFPTQYKNEAQPNVVFESNAAGVPVLSVDVGCISSDIDARNGRVYESQSVFVGEAVTEILALVTNPEMLYLLKKSTLKKVKAQAIEAKIEYKNLVDRITSE